MEKKMLLAVFPWRLPAHSSLSINTPTPTCLNYLLYYNNEIKQIEKCEMLTLLDSLKRLAEMAEVDKIQLACDRHTGR